MSFVFYDTETTGTDTAFDQILQFGAIKTDYELNELSRFEIRCRLLPYVVPAPGAMRVTGVTADQLTDEALPSHYQMMRAIKAKLEEWSPAIFIGHNSLGFDEHLLRQAFYKTLHPPYVTNTNGNCRTDSLRLVQAVARFAPETLAIPLDDRGNPVFKLDRIAPANGFNHTGAHEAIADVEATIHMCRLIAERVPGYWSNFIRFAQKPAVTEFAHDEDIFALTDFYYGKPYSWMVTGIGVNPENGSEFFVFDLSNDPDELAAMPDEELVARLGERPKPVRGMRTNAGPIVLCYDDSPQFLRSAVPELDELKRRVARIKTDAGLSERLIAAIIQTREERVPSVYVEEQIYDGFASANDNTLMDRFHAVDWGARIPLLGQIADERLRSLGQRLVYVEAPDAMNEATRAEYEAAIARRMLGADGEVPWLTLPEAIRKAERLLADASGPEAELLAGHREYLRQQTERAAALLA